MENLSSQSEDPASISRPVVLLFFDGWGIAPENEGNYLFQANLKNFHRLVNEYPAAVLRVFEKSEAVRYRLLLSGGGEPGSLFNLSQRGIRPALIAGSEKSPAIFSQLKNLPPDCFDYHIISSASDYTELKFLSNGVKELSRDVLREIKEGDHQFLAVFSASLELAALSGQKDLVIEIAEQLDGLLGKIAEEVLLKDGILVVGAANGSAEDMFDLRTELVNPNTTLNPTPFLVVGRELKGKILRDDAPGGDLSLLEPVGTLVDVAPTILGLLGLEADNKMIGRNLLNI